MFSCIIRWFESYFSDHIKRDKEEKALHVQWKYNPHNKTSVSQSVTKGSSRDTSVPKNWGKYRRLDCMCKFSLSCLFWNKFFQFCPYISEKQLIPADTPPFYAMTLLLRYFPRSVVVRVIWEEGGGWVGCIDTRAVCQVPVCPAASNGPATPDTPRSPDPRQWGVLGHGLKFWCFNFQFGAGTAKGWKYETFKSF